MRNICLQYFNVLIQYDIVSSVFFFCFFFLLFFVVVVFVRFYDY